MTEQDWFDYRRWKAMYGEPKRVAEIDWWAFWARYAFPNGACFICDIPHSVYSVIDDPEGPWKSHSYYPLTPVVRVWEGAR